MRIQLANTKQEEAYIMCIQYSDETNNNKPDVTKRCAYEYIISTNYACKLEQDVAYGWVGMNCKNVTEFPAVYNTATITYASSSNQ